MVIEQSASESADNSYRIQASFSLKVDTSQLTPLHTPEKEKLTSKSVGALSEMVTATGNTTGGGGGGGGGSGGNFKDEKDPHHSHSEGSSGGVAPHTPQSTRSMPESIRF